MEQKIQFNQCIKNLIINKIDFNYWNKTYNQFIDMSQCGRFTLQEITNYINNLLSASVICKTVNEDTIVNLQKYKLQILKENNPAKDIKSNQVDLLRKIREYKECIASDCLSYLNNQ